jgi:hypothetical protein
VLTTLAEVRATLYEEISVAEIRNTLDLLIVDFSFNPAEYPELKYVNAVIKLINQRLSMPVRSNHEYLFCQYICEWVKNLRYDGIKYSSSLARGGYNYIIFNYNKLKPINSDIYILSNVKYEYSLKKDLPIADHPEYLVETLDTISEMDQELRGVQSICGDLPSQDA